MKLVRILGFLLAFPVSLSLMAGRADARSANTQNNRNGRNSGSYSLMGGDKAEQVRQKAEELKKQVEAQKQQQDAAKKAADAKKAAAAAKQAAAAKPATPKVATAKPAQAARKPGTAKKGDTDREAAAEKLREQAEAAFGKESEEGLFAGVKLLRGILSEYDGTQAAEGAQERLDGLLSNETLGPMILLAEAQEEFGVMHYRKAQNKFRGLALRYPNTEQGAAARAKLAEIDEQDLLKKSVYTEAELEDARLWLLSGNIHMENGRRGEASDAYRKVIEDYPGCRFASTAEQKLPAAQGI